MSGEYDDYVRIYHRNKLKQKVLNKLNSIRKTTRNENDAMQKINLTEINENYKKELFDKTTKENNEFTVLEISLFVICVFLFVIFILNVYCAIKRRTQRTN